MIRWFASVAVSTVTAPVSLLRFVTSAPSLLRETAKDLLPTKITQARQIFNEENLQESIVKEKDSSFAIDDRRVADAIGKGSLVSQPGEYIDLKHGTTHYFLKGPVDGPLIVLLHGVSVFSFVWNRIAELLIGRGYRVLTFDILYVYIVCH